MKKKAKEIIGTCLKTFKGTLYKKFILEDKESNWDGGEYTKQKDFWQEFKQYRQSEEYLELSRKNKENSLKATNPHYLGSRGYASKMDGFESELEMLERLGVEAKTANWEPISIYFCMARGVHHDTDGSFSSTNLALSSLIQRISEVNDEVRQGTRTSNRENDVLTQALRNKEHPSHTRGASLVPWKLAFEEESSTYWSHSRGKVAQEAETLRRLQEIEDRFKRWIDETIQE